MLCVLYIPYGSNKTMAELLGFSIISQLYIPYGSNKTLSKCCLYQSATIFISHMVQIKQTWPELICRAFLHLYIPYGSNKTQTEGVNYNFTAGFISHMVQIKPIIGKVVVSLRKLYIPYGSNKTSFWKSFQKHWD